MGGDLWKHWAKMGRPQYLLPEPSSGLMLAAEAVVKSLRIAFSTVIPDANLLTTYSLRRSAATFADVAALEWSERLALGGWREAIGISKGKAKPNAMPAVYNADKLGAEASVQIQQVRRFASIDAGITPSGYSAEAMEDLHLRMTRRKAWRWTSQSILRQAKIRAPGALA